MHRMGSSPLCGATFIYNNVIPNKHVSMNPVLHNHHEYLNKPIPCICFEVNLHFVI